MLVMTLMLCFTTAAFGEGLGNAHILEACKEMIAGKWEALLGGPLGSSFVYTEGKHFLFITPGNDVYLVWLNEKGKYNSKNCAQIAFSTDGAYLMILGNNSSENNSFGTNTLVIYQRAE